MGFAEFGEAHFRFGAARYAAFLYALAAFLA